MKNIASLTAFNMIISVFSGFLLYTILYIHDGPIKSKLNNSEVVYFLSLFYIFFITYYH